MIRKNLYQVLNIPLSRPNSFGMHNVFAILREMGMFRIRTGKL